MADKKKIIYAEDLFQVLRDDININGANLARARRHIETAPEVDAVEVVRCKGCRLCEMCYPAKPIGEEVIQGWFCKKHKAYRRPDDFCSYGERR